MSDQLRISDIWIGRHPDEQEEQHGGGINVSTSRFNEVAVNIVADNDATCSIYLTVVEAVALSERLRVAAVCAVKADDE